MAEGLKWRVNRAVRQSTKLPAPARHLMLTLAERAKSDTGAIPPEHSPSTVELIKETGQKESTVKKHRAFLEAHGWLTVVRPTGAAKALHAKSTYQLSIGIDCDGVDCAHGKKPSEGHQVTLGTNGRGSAGDPPRGSRHDPRNESEGHQTTDPRVTKQPIRGSRHDPLPITDQYQQNHQEHGAAAPGPDDTGALFAAPPKRESEGQRINRLARTYTDRVKLSNFKAVAALVRTAAGETNPDGSPRYSEKQIIAALDALADKRATVTGNTLRIELDGPVRFDAYAHRPYREDPDDDRPYAGDL